MTKVTLRVCQHCKEKSNILEMEKETIKTGKINKNGKESVRNFFYHKECIKKHEEEKEFKKKEAEELDELYEFIKYVHGLDTVDGRMFKRIQDLRNGTITVNRRQIKKYKQGVTYEQMFIAYRHVETRIDKILRSMNFENKWNEFAYCFSVMVNNLNDAIAMKKKQEKVSIPTEIVSADFNLNVKKRKNRKNSKEDELDISEFL